ncbi:MAG TPA: ABC transporter permease, partial [Caldilinea sp.]|nr:ABC transporter permease [Caldilinea sp.]
MTRYIFRRLLQAIPTLIGVSILSFILVNAAPGDPVTMRTFGDTRMTEEARQILRRQLGLDQHPIVQYFVWMTGLSVQRGDQVAMMTRPGKPCGYVGGIDVTVCDSGGGILRGDLGISLDTKQPVWDRIVERMAATLELGIVSLALSLLIGVPLGVLSAVKHGSIFDNLVRFFAVVFRAVPIFWMGLLLIFVFSV